MNSLRDALGLVAQLDYKIQDSKMHVEDLDEIETLVEKLESLIDTELNKREQEALHDNVV